MALPEFFCWTRFGTEAAEPIDEILARKEQERAANGGVFLWGIGNAIGPSVRELLRQADKPEVLFSPIKGQPRRKDVSPPAVAVWSYGKPLEGGVFPMPQHSIVTSRFDPAAPRRAHYALVCYGYEPLRSSPENDQISVQCLTNILTGRPVGSSQVTAVVQHHRVGPEGTRYEVAIRAYLVHPYLLRLCEPLVV